MITAVLVAVAAALFGVGALTDDRRLVVAALVLSLAALVVTLVEEVRLRRRGYDAAAARPEPADEPDPEVVPEPVPVVEEQLRVGKRETGHGRVRVRSYVVETPVNEQVQLTEERVSIERRPVDRPVTGADAFQERSIEAETRGEEAVVSKEARVVEEIGLRKEAETRTETISDTVRHTEVEIEDDTTGGSTSTTRGGNDTLR